MCTCMYLYVLTSLHIWQKTHVYRHTYFRMYTYTQILTAAPQSSHTPVNIERVPTGTEKVPILQNDIRIGYVYRKLHNAFRISIARHLCNTYTRTDNMFTV